MHFIQGANPTVVDVGLHQLVPRGYGPEGLRLGGLLS